MAKSNANKKGKTLPNTRSSKKRPRTETNGDSEPPNKRLRTIMKKQETRKQTEPWGALLAQGGKLQSHSLLTKLRQNTVKFKVTVLGGATKTSSLKESANLNDSIVCSITKKDHDRIVLEPLLSSANVFLNGKKISFHEQTDLSSADEIALALNSQMFSFVFFSFNHMERFAKDSEYEKNNEPEIMEIDTFLDTVEKVDNQANDESKKEESKKDQANEEENKEQKAKEKNEKDKGKEKASLLSASSSTQDDTEKDVQIIPILLAGSSTSSKALTRMIKRRHSGGRSFSGLRNVAPLPISLDFDFLEHLFSDYSEHNSGKPENNDSKNPSAVKDRFLEQLQKHVLKPTDISESFESFEYFLNPHIRKQLLNSAFMFLKKPEYSKYVSKIPSLSKKILLCGEPGTELYQEELVKALAKHFQSNLLIFDRSEYMLAHGASNAGLPAPEFDDDDDDDDDDEDDDDDDMVTGPTITITATRIEPPAAFEPDEQRPLVKGDRVVYTGHITSQSSVTRHIRRASGGPKIGMRGEVLQIFEDNPNRVGVKFDKPFPCGHTLLGHCEERHGHYASPKELRLEEYDPTIADEALTDALLETVKKNAPCILFIREAARYLSPSTKRYAKFKSEEFDDACVIIASATASEDSGQKTPSGAGAVMLKSSRVSDPSIIDHLSMMDPLGGRGPKDKDRALRGLRKLFPNRIDVLPPQDYALLDGWNKQISSDKKKIKHRTNIQTFQKILKKNSIICTNLEQLELDQKVFSEDDVEQMVGWGVSHHLQDCENIQVDDNKLKIDHESLRHAINLYNSLQEKSAKDALKDVEIDNDFERKMMSEVIPSSEIGVQFEDIGALETVKDTLKELVMLPLQRPELFRKGNLTKPCKGILLFGPPGTGKTMLAKAVATESGASFINVTMSSIGSKWFGEAEKYVRALFSLAKKLAPCVIFIDELDSILGKRDKHGEHEAMRKVKNEFMSCWDGLKSKETERVIVMGASNRPFDLDDAVLRRMPRRLLVDLPDSENRIKILKVILQHEDLEDDFDFEHLAKECEGYSGSDLKNLCVAAAYRPIREILRKENKKRKKKEDARVSEEKPAEAADLRPLQLKDFIKAKDEISASVHEDATSISELRKWNDMYGEGGSRQKQSLTYFL